MALVRARDGQRWPGLGEAASVVVSGLGKRFGAASAGRPAQPWRDAGSVLTITGAAVLAAASGIYG